MQPNQSINQSMALAKQRILKRPQLLFSSELFVFLKFWKKSPTLMPHPHAPPSCPTLMPHPHAPPSCLILFKIGVFVESIRSSLLKFVTRVSRFLRFILRLSYTLSITWFVFWVSNHIPRPFFFVDFSQNSSRVCRPNSSQNAKNRSVHPPFHSRQNPPQPSKTVTPKRRFPSEVLSVSTNDAKESNDVENSAIQPLIADIFPDLDALSESTRSVTNVFQPVSVAALWHSQDPVAVSVLLLLILWLFSLTFFTPWTGTGRAGQLFSLDSSLFFLFVPPPPMRNVMKNLFFRVFFRHRYAGTCSFFWCILPKMFSVFFSHATSANRLLLSGRCVSEAAFFECMACVFFVVYLFFALINSLFSFSRFYLYAGLWRALRFRIETVWSFPHKVAWIMTGKRSHHE